MFGRVKELAPVPLAAPETPALRQARIRIIVVLALVALGCAFFAELRSLTGRFALPVMGGLIVFLAVQVPIWVRAKNRADDDFLMNGSAGDE
jgi:hypothetical protein